MHACIMYEKRRDIKHFRWRHTFHFKPLSFFSCLIYMRGVGGVYDPVSCAVHIYYQACQLCSLCGRDLLGNAHVWYNCWFIYLNINCSGSLTDPGVHRGSRNDDVPAWLLRWRRWRNKAAQPLVKRRLTVSYCLRRLWLPIRHFYSHNHRT